MDKTPSRTGPVCTQRPECWPPPHWVEITLLLLWGFAVAGALLLERSLWVLPPVVALLLRHFRRGG